MKAEIQAFLIWGYSAVKPFWVTTYFVNAAANG